MEKKQVLLTFAFLVKKYCKIFNECENNALKKSKFIYYQQEKNINYTNDKGVPIKDYNTFMCAYIVHRGKKHFYRYCLNSFSIQKY